MLSARRQFLIALSVLFVLAVPLSLSAQQNKVNVNTASAEQLTQITGIGEVTAGNIIEKRDEMGGFEKADDLLEVEGIGEKTLEKMKPFISL